MICEIAVQAGLGFAEFVRVDIGFHSFEGRIRVFAIVSPNVAFRVLRHSSCQSGRQSDARRIAQAAKKKTISRILREVLGVSLSIDFRSSLAALHNLHPVCRLIKPGGAACPQADLAQGRGQNRNSHSLEAAPFVNRSPRKTSLCYHSVAVLAAGESASGPRM